MIDEEDVRASDEGVRPRQTSGTPVDCRDYWLDSAPDAIITHNIEGTITYWNRGAETLYGWSKAEALGSRVNELLGTIAPVPLEKIIEEIRQTGKWQGELRHTVRGGATLVVFSRWNVCPLGCANPDILEINRDLIEQKRLEEGFRGVNRELESMVRDVRSTRELFQGFLESAPDAMVIVRQDGEIALVNAQTERQFGYTAEELLGQDVEILMPERFRKRHLAVRDVYAKNPSVRPMDERPELFGLRKNGEEFPVEIRLSPLTTAEGLLVISSIRDVTERRRVENRLRERVMELERELRERNRE